MGRVLVNRFWMHHFGRGIVASPGDFGMLGDRPTHHDYHATLLRLFGLDPKQLTFLRNSRQQNLLDDELASVVNELLV